MPNTPYEKTLKVHPTDGRLGGPAKFLFDKPLPGAFCSGHGLA